MQRARNVSSPTPPSKISADILSIRLCMDCISSTPATKHRGLENVLMQLLESCHPQSPLHLAVDAVSTRWISKHTQDTHLGQFALLYYTQAIRATDRGYTGTDIIKHNEILVSVVLFAIFETVRKTDEHGAAFQKHVEAANRLVERRQSEGARDADFIKLSEIVQSLTANEPPISPGATPTPTPQIATPTPTSPITNPTAELPTSPSSDRELPQEPPTEPNHTKGQVLRLRCQARRVMAGEERFTNTAVIEELISRAQGVLSSLSQWYYRFTTDNAYRVISKAEDDETNIRYRETWNGTYYLYNSPREAYLDAEYRMLRIYVYSVIVRCRAFLLYPEGLDDQKLKDMREYGPIREAIDHICGIVPYALADADNEISSTEYDTATETFLLHPLDAIVMPLTVALQTEGVSDAQRQWIKSRLSGLSRRYGLNVLRKMAQSTPCLIFRKPCGL